MDIQEIVNPGSPPVMNRELKSWNWGGTNVQLGQEPSPSHASPQTTILSNRIRDLECYTSAPVKCSINRISAIAPPPPPPAKTNHNGDFRGENGKSYRPVVKPSRHAKPVVQRKVNAITTDRVADLAYGMESNVFIKRQTRLFSTYSPDCIALMIDSILGPRFSLTD